MEFCQRSRRQPNSLKISSDRKTYKYQLGQLDTLQQNEKEGTHICLFFPVGILADGQTKEFESHLVSLLRILGTDVSVGTYVKYYSTEVMNGLYSHISLPYEYRCQQF